MFSEPGEQSPMKAGGLGDPDSQSPSVDVFSCAH